MLRQVGENPSIGENPLDSPSLFPFVLILSKGRSWFDRLTTNGIGIGMYDGIIGLSRPPVGRFLWTPLKPRSKGCCAIIKNPIGRLDDDKS